MEILLYTIAAGALLALGAWTVTTAPRLRAPFDLAWDASSVLASLHDALWVFDTEGRLLFANDVARQQFEVGADHDGHVDRLFRSPGEARAFRHGPWARALDGLRRHGLEMTLRGRHGHSVPVLASLSPTRLRGRDAIVLLAHDISVFRQVEEDFDHQRANAEPAPRDGPWLHRYGDDLLVLAGALAVHIEHLQFIGTDAADDGNRLLALTNEVRRMIGDLVELARSDAGALPMEAEELDLGKALGGLEPLIRELGQTTGTPIQVERTPAPILFDRAYLPRVVMASLELMVSLAPERRIEVAISRIGERTVLGIRVPECPAPRDRVDAALLGTDPTGRTARQRLSLALARRLVQRSGGTIGLKQGETAPEVTLQVAFRATASMPVRPLPSEAHTVSD